jgi:hypothetical protein
MLSTVKIIQDIITKMAAVNGGQFADSFDRDVFELPRLIPAGTDKGTIQITKEIDDLVTSLARALKENQKCLARRVKDGEWHVWVRTTIGPLLAETSAPSDDAAQSLLKQLQGALNDLVAGLSVREYAFGASLFSNTDVPTFTIGPVTFEPRDVWLDRKESEGEFSAVTKRRIKQRWSGQRVSQRKSNREQIREDDIIAAVGPCPYVCTVKLSSNFASDAALETALTTARLALTCASLAFQTPSQVLLGFNLHYDGPIHLQKALLFIPNKIVFAGSRMNRRPHGPLVLAQDWQATLTRLAPTFSGCGEVLDRFVGPTQQTTRAPLLDTLLQSLIWFEKGCREVGDLMAIVDFAASLDALGKGTKAGGILKVLEARLGIKSTDPVNTQGPTLQSIMDTIYSDGRSRTIHGTNDKVGFDWGHTRATAEQLARWALVACLEYAANTLAATKPDDLKR